MGDSPEGRTSGTAGPEGRALTRSPSKWREVTQTRSFDELKRHSIGGGGEIKRSWPMWVLPVAEALKLKRLPTHEELMRDKKLVEWRAGMGPVAFFSQTWLSRNSPDDEANSKCTLMRELLLRAVLGKLEINGHFLAQLQYGSKELRVSATQMQADLSRGFIWFDIISVPQSDKQAQELSITACASARTRGG